MKDLIRIRDGNGDDTSFILSSWLKSYRYSDACKDIPKHNYFLGHHEFAERALSRGQVYCAVDKNNLDQIYGWICLEWTSNKPTLHYCYVKHIYRGLGIAKMLIEESFGESNFDHSHLIGGKFKKLLNDHGVFDPYTFFKGAA